MNLYSVEINGIEHTMQLDAEDAKRYDAKAVKAKAEPEEQPEAEHEQKAAPVAANKARRPAANK